MTCKCKIGVVYFLVYLALIIICACIHGIHPYTGIFFQSVVPSLSLVAIFAHYVFCFVSKSNTNGSTGNNNNLNKSKIYDNKLYFIAGIIMFVFVFLTTIFMVKILGAVPKEKNEIGWISAILKFPFDHSIAGKDSDGQSRLRFYYPYQFIVVIIGPLFEECFKYVCIVLSIISIKMLQKCGCIKNNLSCKNTSSTSDSGSYTQYYYQMKCLMFTFIAVCISASFAMFENMWYLMFCEWSHTADKQIWNQGLCFSPIRSAAEGNGRGIMRGLLSVPGHVMDAVITVNVLFWWMKRMPKSCTNKIMDFGLKIIWCLLSFPISIFISVLLHASFNYWLPMLGSILFLGISITIVVVILHRRNRFIRTFFEERKGNDIQMV